MAVTMGGVFQSGLLVKSAAHSMQHRIVLGFGQDFVSRMLFGLLVTSPDQSTSSLKDLLFDLEEVAAGLAQLDGIAVASDQAKHLAFALAVAASAIARDAALIVISLENSALGSSHSQQRRNRLSQRSGRI